MITSVDAAVAAINAAGVDLRLPAIRKESARIADEAARENLDYLPFLAECLAAEIDARTQRRMERRLLEAKFPRMKKLEDFNIEAGPKAVTSALLGALREGAFIEAGTPLVFLGDSGTGKSHLLIGTGVAAARAGKRVRYVTTAALVNELSEAADDKCCHALLHAMAGLTCCVSTSLATCNSTRVVLSCCSKSSPNAKRNRRLLLLQMHHSASGVAPSPTLVSWQL